MIEFTATAGIAACRRPVEDNLVMNQMINTRGKIAFVYRAS